MNEKEKEVKEFIDKFMEKFHKDIYIGMSSIMYDKAKLKEIQIRFQFKEERK